MRHYLINNSDIYKSLDNINNKLIDHDEKIVYLCGTSINYMGNKIFTINKLEDKLLINTLLSEINKII